MQMFLMVLSLSLVGVLVSAVLFAAASRDARRAATVVATAAADEERFFLMRPVEPVRRRMVPADVLALQIEQHVRLEQAAAEGFRQFPTAESLHTPTLSLLAS